MFYFRIVDHKVIYSLKCSNFDGLMTSILYTLSGQKLGTPCYVVLVSISWWTSFRPSFLMTEDIRLGMYSSSYLNLSEIILINSIKIVALYTLRLNVSASELLIDLSPRHTNTQLGWDRVIKADIDANVTQNYVPQTNLRLF